MSQRKSERIVNLTILLLSSRRYLPKEKIRESVEGYRDQTEAAFERMFERDKDELRAMGVPIETGTNDVFFADDEGYRISRADFELPPMEFSAAEAAVLGLAAQVWQQASSAESTVSALTKLRAAGLDPDASRLAALQPTVNAPEPSFEVIRDAMIARQAVAFTYRGSDAERTVEPWLLPFRNGAWYLIAHDRSRGERRTFKLSRITSPPRLVGRAGAFTLPDTIDATIETFEREADTHEALLAIRSGHAPVLRRRGRLDEAQTRPASLPDDFELWRVPYVRTDEMVSEIAQSAPAVVVLAPDDLVTSHVQHLESVIAQHDTDGGQP